VLKICPLCKRTWSGGRDCPNCGEGHPLIDVAEPTGRKVFLRDRELASAIRGYYGARTGMLVAFWGILLGLVFAIALARKALVAPVGHAAPWWVAAVLCALVPVAIAVFAGDRIVRRFTRGCIGRAPGPQDIRVAPRADSRRDHLAFGQRG
jgi:hypothetical protein